MPRPLYPRERAPGTHWIGGWVSPRTGLNDAIKEKWESNEAVHQLFIDFETAYDSVRREVLYDILTEFGVAMKLVRPTVF
jgi:hypothetical protein